MDRKEGVHWRPADAVVVIAVAAAVEVDHGTGAAADDGIGFQILWTSARKSFAVGHHPDEPDGAACLGTTPWATCWREGRGSTARRWSWLCRVIRVKGEQGPRHLRQHQHHAERRARPPPRTS